MEKLRNYKKLFFIGIGGIGMSALAIILKERGFDIIGSDKSKGSTITRLLQKGIKVFNGHNAENIKKDIDAVIYTNAIPDDNPELIRAKELNIPLYDRATILDIVSSTKYSIGVSGTHGKTTTTSMISKIFLNSGLSPSLAVGGELEEINGSGYEGNGKYFIYEACEAFGSFLKLHPDIAVITNIDADHLDYYKNLDNIKNAFEKYIRENIPPHGILIYNNDDKNLREVVYKIKNIKKVSIGIKSRNVDYRAENIILKPFSSKFSIKSKDEKMWDIEVNIPGKHNVYNALLAFVTAKINGISFECIHNTLANFKNADRRFQLKLNKENLIVIDDYAHHPAEINATLKAAKNISEKTKAQLIAIFQPHLYSRTEQFYKDFALSLSIADKVILTEIYAAREKNQNNISTKIIYDEIVKIKGKDKVIYTEDIKEIPEKVKNIMNKKNLVLTLGAGDVWKVSDMFVNNN